MPAQHEFVPASSLIIPLDGQRKHFDSLHILELSNSIKGKELIHAILVRMDGKTVVAGRCRLRAVIEHLIPMNQEFIYGGEQVPPGCVPIIRCSTDDPLEIMELEYDENAKRRALSWQEDAEATAMLHDLRQRQLNRKHEEAVQALPGVAVVAPVQTIAATAQEIHGRSDGDYQQKVRAEVIVAKHLDDPDVAGAKTAKEALKIIQRKDREKVHQQMALVVGKSFSPQDHTLLQGDCLELLAKPVFQGKYDVILTDPPYGMGADKFGDGGGKLTNALHHYEDSYESWQLLIDKWAKLSFAVTKPEAHAYVFCDFDRFHELKGFMEAAGWTVHRTPLIVYKIGSGRVPWPENGPRRQWETILYAMKGKKKVNAIKSDVIEASADENMDFGAQKPVSLFVDLLSRSIHPGAEVLDSFAGTGPCLPAAHSFQCKATLIEMEEAQFGKILSRVKDLP